MLIPRCDYLCVKSLRWFCSRSQFGQFGYSKCFPAKTVTDSTNISKPDIVRKFSHVLIFFCLKNVIDTCTIWDSPSICHFQAPQKHIAITYKGGKVPFIARTAILVATCTNWTLKCSFRYIYISLYCTAVVEIS